MTGNHSSLPTLQADLLLLHPPAFFDFRERRDIYFPFLGTSGDVPITPLYEYFPLGFKTLQRFLTDCGYDVKIINLSTVLLKYPNLELGAILSALDVGLIGIDLHWMVHVQGSLAIAKEIKEFHPEIPVIFGGISSNYYATELIKYPFIDMVMRGYDTHLPMAALLDAIQNGKDLATIPNLLYKSKDGEIEDNGLTHMPDTYGYGIDWAQQPMEAVTQTLPILEVLSTHNVGCKYKCGWCGGSQDAFRRVFSSQKPIVYKPSEEILFELDSLKCLHGIERYHFYSVGSYNHSKTMMNCFIERIAESEVGSVSYEQHQLTPDEILKQMARANPRTTITLSPESHDIQVASLAGRGVYTNQELEHWLEKAFEAGIYKVDIWYFVGMPEQDEGSVMATVDYCQHLLKKFKGTNINPMICPMVPLLDPGSTFFEQPADHGYRVFYRTVEEHRQGMMRASMINRINYETKWLTRSEIVNTGFKAVRRLVEAKAIYSFLPRPWAEDYVSKIDDALEFMEVVHEIDCISDKATRMREMENIGDDILERNNLVLFSGVSNQAFPVNRQIGGRWFDELGWEESVLDTISCGCEESHQALG
jgi:clorobiocin biosynthesis protein CloN6